MSASASPSGRRAAARASSSARSDDLQAREARDQLLHARALEVHDELLVLAAAVAYPHRADAEHRMHHAHADAIRSGGRLFARLVHAIFESRLLHRRAHRHPAAHLREVLTWNLLQE